MCDSEIHSKLILWMDGGKLFHHLADNQWKTECGRKRNQAHIFKVQHSMVKSDVVHNLFSPENRNCSSLHNILTTIKINTHTQLLCSLSGIRSHTLRRNLSIFFSLSLSFFCRFEMFKSSANICFVCVFMQWKKLLWRQISCIQKLWIKYTQFTTFLYIILHNQN